MKNKLKNISEVLFQWLANVVDGNANNTPCETRSWDNQDWEIAKTIVYIHGMGPIWGSLIKQGLSSTGMPKFFADYLCLQYDENTKRVESIHSELERIGRKLSNSGIDFLPFKGIELSKHVYDSAGMRPMADIDLYVGTANAERAISVIKELGYVVCYCDDKGATLCPSGFQESAVRGDPEARWVSTLLIADKENKWYDGESVDVQCSIDVHFCMKMEKRFFNYDMSRFFEEALHEEDKTLSNEVHFTYIALHCAKHLLSCSGRWIQLFDMTLFLKRKNMDVNKVVQISQKLEISHLVILPLMLIQKIFPLPCDEIINLLSPHVKTRHRILAGRAELSEMSCCNPWSKTLVYSLLWIKSWLILLNGIRYELSHERTPKKSGEDGVNELKKRGLLKRAINIFNNVCRRQTTPSWHMLKIQGLDPRRDWK